MFILNHLVKCKGRHSACQAPLPGRMMDLPNFASELPSVGNFSELVAALSPI